MRIVTMTWADMHREGDLWWRLLAHRHDKFVKELGWEIPTASRREDCGDDDSGDSFVEFDQYDSPHAVYVMALDEEGAIQASARLVRTDTRYRFGPYDVSYMIADARRGLLDNIPPDLLPGDAPRSSRVWELTRYTSLSRKASRALFDALNEFLAGCGATDVLTLSPPSFIRWLKLITFEGELIGPAMEIDGEEFAVVRTRVKPVSEPRHGAAIIRLPEDVGAETPRRAARRRAA